MVVQGIIALALALPTGLLFGVGYGTGVRVGYEQVYPLLFPADKDNRNVTPTVENIKRLNTIYDSIGGKEASQMGIAKGLSDAMTELNNNPDFQALMELEYTASGRIPSNLGPRNKSQKPTSSQEGFLSDTQRAAALEQLQINRQKSILENQQFLNRNKQTIAQNKFRQSTTSTVKVDTSIQSNTIILRYIKKTATRPPQNVTIAVKGNLQTHQLTLRKWRKSFQSLNNTSDRFIRVSLNAQIKAYVIALQRLYPTTNWFKL